MKRLAIYDPNAVALNDMNAMQAAETYERRIFDVTTSTYLVFLRLLM